MKARLRAARRFALDSAFWKPDSLRAHWATRPGRARTAGSVNAMTRIIAAGDWLRRAQDATGDGGVAWAYGLHRGWGPSYPETTGYIIPTLLDLAAITGDDDFADRARRCLDFLLPLQLPGGAFPAGTLEETERRPSIFNTGQIICGLNAWYRRTGDAEIGEVARRAGSWLIDQLDDDGAWRRHGYLAYPVTYTAHSSCWVAELGVLLEDPDLKAGVGRHLDWVLAQQDAATGWFERAGFSAEDHAARRSVTHTLAYTIWGVLHAGLALDRPDAVAAARRAARAVAARVEADGWLPGMLDANWSGQARYACLTGNAQMALVWLRLDTLESEPALVRAADRVMDLVGAAQSLANPDPGIRGGIPGSDPIMGDYVRGALPNWAAKFTIDALVTRERAAGRLGGPP